MIVDIFLTCRYCY